MSTSEAHQVRQVFQYLLLLGLVIVSAEGVAGLAGAVLGQDTALAASDTAIARSVAFTVVGLPLLAGVGWWSRRTQAADPAETRSPGWLLHLAGGLLVALLVAVTSLHVVVGWLVDLRPYDPFALARAFVWTATWAAYWWLVSRQRDRLLVQPHVLGGSLVGLVLMMIGWGSLFAAAMETWFGLDGGEVIASRSSAPILQGSITLLLGALTWAVHWWVRARTSPATLLWLAYVLLAGVAASLVVALVAGSLALYRAAVWLVGDPWSDADVFFEPMPETLAAAVTGLVSLAYHHGVLRSAARPERTEVDRVRDYLLAAIGLGAAAAGTTIVVVALVEAIADPDVIVGGGAGNTVLAALTLLGVGGPVWWLHWRRGQRASASPDRLELRSPTRRLYLALLLGVATLAAVVALLAGAWVLVDRMLQDEDGLEVLRGIRFPLGILFTAGAVAAYHWSVWLRGRDATPERTGLRFVLLLGVADAATADEVRRTTGAVAWAWARTDGVERAWPREEVLAALAATTAPEVVVLADGDRLQVLPIERRPVRAAPALASGGPAAAPGRG